MNVLVTGGAGYVGSHACKALSKAGYTPIAYDSLVRGNRWSVKWGPLEVGDIADRPRLDAVIAKYRPVAVMHFAAFAYVDESVRDPGRYYRNNVAGTLTLLESMRDHDIDVMVFSSSCATYGKPASMPITEDFPQRPINPYGMSKLVVERILQDFDSAHGLRSISLRYFNAAGADPDAEIGECHDPETHLIPLVLATAAGRRPTFTVYGDDYDTPDGTCIRDYVHVSDLSWAHLLALDALMQGAQTTAYNLGNGQGFSVREVIDETERVTNREVPCLVGPRREGDPPTLVGDPSSIKAKLGWSPKRRDLTEILRTAWVWLQKQH